MYTQPINRVCSLCSSSETHNGILSRNDRRYHPCSIRINLTARHYVLTLPGTAFCRHLIVSSRWSDREVIHNVWLDEKQWRTPLPCTFLNIVRKLSREALTWVLDSTDPVGVTLGFYFLTSKRTFSISTYISRSMIWLLSCHS